MFEAPTLDDGRGRQWASTGVSLGLYAAVAAGLALSAAAVQSEAVQKQVDVIFRAPPAPAPTAAPPPPPPRSKPQTAKSLAPVVPTQIPDATPTPAEKSPEPAASAADTKDDGGVEGGVAGGVKGGVVGGTLGGVLREPVNLPENATPPQASSDNTQPQFPESARAAGLEGQVILKIVVKEDGSVGKIDVMRGDEPFVSAAVAAVRTWHYSPALVAGLPTAVFRIVKVPFRIRT